jgi:hypothetical protein
MSSPDTQQDTFVPLSVVQRVLKRSRDSIKSAALSGAIRTRVIPGSRILYSYNDARKLADRIPVSASA